MLKATLARLKQGYRTLDFPSRAPELPDRFRGRPALDASRCVAGCAACVEACPTGAVAASGPRSAAGDHPALALDLGRCLFCLDCVSACPGGAIAYTNEHRLAARGRDDLVLRSGPGPGAGGAPPLAVALDRESRRLFGRSLRLRQVSAGGCNACEAESAVLGTVVFDLGRFGVQFVASPRHADGVLVTGPVTSNMRLALEKTWAAVPGPKIAIAVGACAIAGGPYIDHPETENGAAGVIPIDLLVPGCPPHPLTILDGILRLLGRL